MAYSIKFMYPIRQSLAAITSSISFTSLPRQSFYTKSEPLKRLMKGFQPVLRSHVSRFQCSLNTQGKYFHNFYFPGSQTRFRSVLAVSAVFGLMTFAPNVSYAMDDLDNWAYEHRQESWDSSHAKEDSNAFWRFAKRFWLPVFFFLTVIAHLDDPVTVIAFKIILFLFSTKPSPFSVYVVVDELCNRSLRQDPHLYGVKSLYAHKVEVQDYKLLCLARVEVRDQKFSLVGILGSWWPLPRPSQGAFSILGLVEKLKAQQLECT